MDAFNIFEAQSWHSELLNGVSDVFVEHLEPKLLQFELILQFPNLAYFYMRPEVRLVNGKNQMTTLFEAFWTQLQII